MPHTPSGSEVSDAVTDRLDPARVAGRCTSRVAGAARATASLVVHVAGFVAVGMVVAALVLPLRPDLTEHAVAQRYGWVFAAAVIGGAAIWSLPSIPPLHRLRVRRGVR